MSPAQCSADIVTPGHCFVAWGTLWRDTPEGILPVAPTGPFYGTHWWRGAEAVNAGSGKPLQCCVEERTACQEDRHRLQLEGELTAAKEPCLLSFTICGYFASAQSSLCSLTSGVQGEGLIPGGILVVRSGTGGVVYAHQEQTFGDHAPIAEVWLMPCADIAPFDGSVSPGLHHVARHVHSEDALSDGSTVLPLRADNVCCQAIQRVAMVMQVLAAAKTAAK